MLNTILTLEELFSCNVKYYFLWGSWFTGRTNHGYHAMRACSFFDMQNDEKGGNTAAVQRVTSGHEGNLTAGFKEFGGLASRDSGGTSGS